MLTLFAAQFVAMRLRNGEIGGLWPLGPVLFSVRALPAIVVAKQVVRHLPRRR